jgi:hypothetical protein
VWLQTPPQRTLTVGLTLRDNAAYPLEAERHICLHRPGGLCPGTWVAITHAQTQWQAITAHAETQESLREILLPILALPRGRPWGDRALRTWRMRGAGGSFWG